MFLSTLLSLKHAVQSRLSFYWLIKVIKGLKEETFHMNCFIEINLGP